MTSAQPVHLRSAEKSHELLAFLVEGSGLRHDLFQVAHIRSGSFPCGGIYIGHMAARCKRWEHGTSEYVGNMDDCRFAAEHAGLGRAMVVRNGFMKLRRKAPLDSQLMPDLGVRESEYLYFGC